MMGSALYSFDLWFPRHLFSSFPLEHPITDALRLGRNLLFNLLERCAALPQPETLDLRGIVIRHECASPLAEFDAFLTARLATGAVVHPVFGQYPFSVWAVVVIVMHVSMLGRVLSRVSMIGSYLRHYAAPFFSFGFRFFAHLALAAVAAIWLRRLPVRVTNRRLPPIRPPFRPISAMTRETMALLTGTSASPTDARTTRWAFWTVSSLGVLMRFGMVLECYKIKPCQGRSISN
jgi:hypothetical protein